MGLKNNALVASVASNMTYERALSIATTVSKLSKSVSKVLDEMIIPELTKRADAADAPKVDD